MVPFLPGPLERFRTPPEIFRRHHQGRYRHNIQVHMPAFRNDTVLQDQVWIIIQRNMTVQPDSSFLNRWTLDLLEGSFSPSIALRRNVREAAMSKISQADLGFVVLVAEEG